MNDIIQLSDAIEKLAYSLQKEEKEYISKTELAHLSAVQLHYIDMIYHAENPSLSECAQILAVSKPSVTITVDKLVELGLVEKIKSDEDRRSSHLHLTVAGKKIAKIHDEFHHQYTYKMFGNLTGSDLRTLLSILKKIFPEK